MSMRSDVVAIIRANSNVAQPTVPTQCRITTLTDVEFAQCVNELNNYCEQQYMAGKAMERRLLRLKLGLAVESDA